MVRSEKQTLKKNKCILITNSCYREVSVRHWH